MPDLKTYLKLCTEFYDLDKQHDPHSAEYRFFMEYAQCANGKILEPMCGTGRFLIPMLQAGYDIQGFDASPHMLHALREKYAKIAVGSPPVWQQFVQDFSSDRLYSLIFVPFGSWGLITDQYDNKKSLKIMYQHLQQGGTFILHIETVASVPQPCGIWRRGVHKRVDGSKIAINTLADYNAQTQIFSAFCRYESIVQDSVVATEEEHFKQYLYRYDEMDLLLQEAGFVDIKKYQDYAKTPATDGASPFIIYECTK